MLQRPSGHTSDCFIDGAISKCEVGFTELSAPNSNINPLMPTVAIWVIAIKHPVPDQVKLLFVIFDIRIL